MSNSISKSSPRIVTRCADVFRAVQEVRAAGKTVGVVPTMGALHEGHLSLARASHTECDFTIATIFVNPTQFGPKEDFGKYPRTLEADVRLLSTCDTDLVFVPPNDEMYPSGFSTFVQPPQVALPLDGQARPDHFRGVATVVLKLFNVIPANRAFFGQKDYQQSLVIRRMVRDLNVPIEIRVCPIVREPDGLAMSSRNRYLSPSERQQALAISRCLRFAANEVKQGQRRADELQQQMLRILNEVEITQIDYVAFAHPETLDEVADVVPGTVALIAARVGTTRLIDNEILT